MTTCRVCASPIGEVAYEASAPALTSMMAFIDIPTLVFVCDDCGHAQCADLPDIETFYDTTYRISLESDDHDQIFAVAADGSPIYRTDHQAAIGLRLMDLPQGLGDLRSHLVRKAFFESAQDSRPVGEPDANHEGKAEALPVAPI